MGLDKLTMYYIVFDVRHYGEQIPIPQGLRSERWFCNFWSSGPCTAMNWRPSWTAAVRRHLRPRARYAVSAAVLAGNQGPDPREPRRALGRPGPKAALLRPDPPRPDRAGSQPRHVERNRPRNAPGAGERPCVTQSTDISRTSSAMPTSRPGRRAKRARGTGRASARDGRPQRNPANPTEVYAMLKDQFGNPKRLGRGIAAAKGRTRTYFKKMARKLPLRRRDRPDSGVRRAICGRRGVLHCRVRRRAQSFRSEAASSFTNSIKSFNPGDVVVYQHSPVASTALGTIVRESPIQGGWLIERNNGREERGAGHFQRQNIVGRVFLNTR
jgi:hypothetical protein